MDPDAEDRKTLAAYRRALEISRDLKPAVRELGLKYLRRGVSTETIARWTGETAELYRRLARSHGIEPPEAYRSRADRARERARGEQG